MKTTKIRQLRPLAVLLLPFSMVVLEGCASSKNTDQNTPQKNNANKPVVLEEIESLVLCKQNDQGITIESKVKAEYGFKRFAKNAFRPIASQRLFGHEVRVVEFSEDGNKIYVAGNPLEFGHHFKPLLPDITCADNTCQAPLDNGQSLLIYKAKLKKSKDTTVIECTKANQSESEATE